MWKTSSTVLLDDVISKVRANHGVFLAEESDESILCYDPIGREWVALMNNQGYSDLDECKPIGPYTSVGVSFGPSRASISSVRVGVVVKKEN
jgi:hypothetical protein